MKVFFDFKKQQVPLEATTDFGIVKLTSTQFKIEELGEKTKQLAFCSKPYVVHVLCLLPLFAFYFLLD